MGKPTRLWVWVATVMGAGTARYPCHSLIKISQKPMINKETLTNPYPYLPKPVPMVTGMGFLWGRGPAWPQKPQGYP